MTETSLNTLFSTELNRAYKPLTQEEEIIFIVHAQNGCIKSRNMIINSQLRKLAEIARSYMRKNSRCDVSELLSVGISGYQGKNGLDQAIMEFDITKGTRFITFAYPFIVNPIRDYSLDNRTIRVPRNHSKSNPRCPILVEKYTYEADLMNMTLDEYIEYRNSKCDGEPITLRSRAVVVNTPSLDTPLDGRNDTTLEDMIADEMVDMDFAIVQKEINDTLKTLTTEEQKMIEEYYWHELTVEDIGNARGISRQAVSIRLIKILDKAKKRYGNPNYVNINE